MQIAINGRFLTQQPTGVQRYAAGVLDAMDKLMEGRSDVSVTVFSPRLAGARPVWRNLVHREDGHFQGNLWEQLDLPRLSRGHVLFCPGNSSPIISLLRKQPVIVTVHDLSYCYFPEAYSRSFRLWYNTIIPLAMKNAATILTVSESERQSIIGFFPGAAERIHAIANGGWPDERMPTPEADQDRPNGYVLYVGSLSKRKNFPAMLEAAISLVRKRGFRFRFVGGTSASLTASNLRLPGDVASKIELIGQIDDMNVLGACYRDATCFMFPSRYESSGLPPAEAMAWGCPVIASDIAALRERCRDAALYCDPDDLTSIAAAIERMMDDAELRSTYRARGYRRAGEISWQRCARETLDIMSATIKNQYSRPKP